MTTTIIQYAEVGLLQPAEPCVHEQIVRPWELLCTPTGREYGFRLRYIKSQSLVIYIEEYATAMRMRGLGPRNMLVVSVPVSTIPDTLYWNSPVNSSGFHCMLPGEIDARLGTGQRHFIVLIDLTLLRQHLSCEQADALEIQARNQFLPARYSNVQAFSTWLGNLLCQASRNPAMFNTQAVINALQADVLHRLVESIDFPSFSKAPARMRMRKANRGLNRALEIISDNPEERISIPQICSEAGISQRSLERKFQEVFDMTAHSYLRHRRFHQVRLALMAAREGTVSDIAHRHGFYELGHFAVQYARLFGERPSQTLSHMQQPLSSSLLLD